MHAALKTILVVIIVSGLYLGVRYVGSVIHYACAVPQEDCPPPFQGLAEIAFYGTGGTLVPLWSHTALSSDHSWQTFTNSNLGFTLEYPSDILTPAPDAATATTSVDFPHIGKTTEGNADDGIRIAMQQTSAPNVAAYIKTIQTPFAPKEIMLDGEAAMEFDELAYADYTIYAVHNGRVFIIVLNLPQTDGEHIIGSFRWK